MSHHITGLGPGRNVPRDQARGAILEQDDETTSLQALIDILRKPQAEVCPYCYGRGKELAGDHCGHCYGTGRRPVSRSSW